MNSSPDDVFSDPQEKPAPEGAEGSSTPQEQERSRGPFGGLFDTFFSSSGKKQTPSTGSRDASKASEEDDPFPGLSSSAPPQRIPDGEPQWTPPKTKEEFERSIQSEVDRRAEAQKQREARALSETVRASRNKELLDLEREKDEAITDGDLAKAQQLSGRQRVLLAQQRQGEWIQNTMLQFDQHTLVPLFEGLDPKDTERVVKELENMEPLPGRAHAVKEALKLHEKRIRAETRKKLLSDEAFLIEARGHVPDDEEAMHLEGRAASNGKAPSGANALQELILSSRG